MILKRVTSLWYLTSPQHQGADLYSPQSSSKLPACSSGCRGATPCNALHTGPCDPSPAHLAADYHSWPHGAAICLDSTLRRRTAHSRSNPRPEQSYRLAQSPCSEARPTHCILTINNNLHYALYVTWDVNKYSVCVLLWLSLRTIPQYHTDHIRRQQYNQYENIMTL